MAVKEKLQSQLAEFKKIGFNGTREGEFISLKEFVSYSVGGMGVQGLFKMTSYAALAATSLLMGSVYGISPTHLAIMANIVIILNIIKTPIISMLMDNNKSKKGKFRPFVLYSGIPATILLCAITWIPLDSRYWFKCVSLCGLYFLTMVFETLQLDSFKSLGQVMSSNTGERARLISISQIVYNLSPSIIGLIYPIMAVMISDEGMLDITTYRILFPIFSIPSVIIGIIAYKGTRERTIVPKNFVQKVKFKEGISQIAKNKYFWLLTTGDTLGILRFGISINFLSWYCVYHLENQAMYGLLSTLLGNASLPGMLLAPLLIKKLGVRNAQIFDYTVHAFFGAMLFFCMDNDILFFICMYLCVMGLGADFVIRQSMMSHIYDYQQLKTGQRIEGFMTQFTVTISTTAGIAFSLVLPTLYKHFGLVDDYSVLFNDEIRANIFNCLIATTVISTALAIIPYFFYDLTTEKHAEILAQLKKIAAKSEKETETVQEPA